MTHCLLRRRLQLFNSFSKFGRMSERCRHIVIRFQCCGVVRFTGSESIILRMYRIQMRMQSDLALNGFGIYRNVKASPREYRIRQPASH